MYTQVTAKDRNNNNKQTSRWLLHVHTELQLYVGN